MLNDARKRLRIPHTSLLSDQGKNLFLRESFFKKESVDLNCVELSLVHTIFGHLKSVFQKYTIDPDLNDRMRRLAEEEDRMAMKFAATLDTALERAYNVSYGDPEAKIGEICRPCHKATENFSFTLPLNSKFTLVFLVPLSLYKPHLIAKHEADLFLPKPSSSNTYLANLANLAIEAAPNFYKKMLSFCNITSLNMLRNLSHPREYVSDPDIVVEIRII